MILTDESGNEIEVSRTKVGFRRFELKNGIMCLNGKRIIFKGINRHEFDAKTGRAITKEDMLFDIQFMKKTISMQFVPVIIRTILFGISFVMHMAFI